MKIEQRIGRCHRYGQKNDVVAINLLNTQNAADKRVYEILSKKFELFEGVFGASDIALGVLESGTNFEKIVLNIYQSCNTAADFNKAFDKLNCKLNTAHNKKALKLRDILITESSGAKKLSLEGTKKDIERYFQEVDYWSGIPEPKLLRDVQYWKATGWDGNIAGIHGYVFLGSMCDNADLLFPVLLLRNREGEYVDSEESELVSALEQIDDSCLYSFTPTAEESGILQQAYRNLVSIMLDKIDQHTRPIREYNRHKIGNWMRIQSEQLALRYQEMKEEIEELKEEDRASDNYYKKIDIKVEIAQKQRKLDAFHSSFHKRVDSYKSKADQEIAEFDKMLEADNPILLINAILSF